MPTRGFQARQPGETDHDYSVRLRRRAEFFRQVNEEVRFAAAGRGLSMSEISRRMGDPKGRTVAGQRGGYSMAKLADIATAMGVTFRLVAIPDSDMNANGAYRPRNDRLFKPDEVRAIRLRLQTESQRQVARELGVSQGTIGDIARGYIYRDVE
jgi:transcriptional regulator with XRE-family HTH domain